MVKLSESLRIQWSGVIPETRGTYELFGSELPTAVEIELSEWGVFEQCAKGAVAETTFISEHMFITHTHAHTQTVVPIDECV